MFKIILYFAAEKIPNALFITLFSHATERNYRHLEEAIDYSRTLFYYLSQTFPFRSAHARHSDITKCFGKLMFSAVI
jgi:hypothetical protein